MMSKSRPIHTGERALIPETIRPDGVFPTPLLSSALLAPTGPLLISLNRTAAGEDPFPTLKRMSDIYDIGYNPPALPQKPLRGAGPACIPVKIGLFGSGMLTIKSSALARRPRTMPYETVSSHCE